MIMNGEDLEKSSKIPDWPRAARKTMDDSLAQELDKVVKEAKRNQKWRCFMKKDLKKI